MKGSWCLTSVVRLTRRLNVVLNVVLWKCWEGKDQHRHEKTEKRQDKERRSAGFIYQNIWLPAVNPCHLQESKDLFLLGLNPTVGCEIHSEWGELSGKAALCEFLQSKTESTEGMWKMFRNKGWVKYITCKLKLNDQRGFLFLFNYYKQETNQTNFQEPCRLPAILNAYVWTRFNSWCSLVVEIFSLFLLLPAGTFMFMCFWYGRKFDAQATSTNGSKEFPLGFISASERSDDVVLKLCQTHSAYQWRYPSLK